MHSPLLTLPNWKVWFPGSPGNARQRASGTIRDTLRLHDGAMATLRSARQEDACKIQQLVRGLSARSRYLRFFNPIHELPPDILARFVSSDPTQARTLLVTVPQHDQEIAIAMAQYVADPYPRRGEFAVVVADRWQHHGIGHTLIKTLMEVAEDAGLERMEGDILAENVPMVRLMIRMGFMLAPDETDTYVWKASKILRPLRTAAPLPQVPTRAQRGSPNRIAETMPCA